MQRDKKYSVHHREKAFTLVEMIMTLVLIGILVAIALPSYRAVMQNMRVSSVSNDFMATLSYARSEALKRNQPVSICAATDSDFTRCGSNSNWANGWIVFVDSDSNGIIASSSDRLKTHDALSNGSLILSSLPYITYNHSGFLGSNAGSFTISTAGCSGSSAQLITLSIIGRASVTSAACTLP